MNTNNELDILFETASDDVGCSAGFELLHRYVEEELTGGPADATYPGVATHLKTCPACREDYLGLRESAQTYGDIGPTLP